MLGRRNDHVNNTNVRNRTKESCFAVSGHNRKSNNIENDSACSVFEDSIAARVRERRDTDQIAQGKRCRLSDVLDGEPQNLLPTWFGSKPAIHDSEAECPIILMNPSSRFKVQFAVKTGDFNENLRFNIGGLPSWQCRLIRGDRLTSRRRQLLQRVLVSASTLEVNSRIVNMYPSFSLADKDQVFKSRQKTNGQSKCPISALNSLGALSASARDDLQGSCTFGAKQASMICREARHAVNTTNDKSKFRSTVIPSIKVSSKFRPSLNILEGGGEDFDASQSKGREQYNNRGVVHENPSSMKERPKDRFPANSFGMFFSDEIKEMYEPANICQIYQELILNCRSLDSKSFEQSEEFILELEGVIDSILMNENVTGILKDILECGRIYSFRQRDCQRLRHKMHGRQSGIFSPNSANLQGTENGNLGLTQVLTETYNYDSKAELVRAELEAFLLVEKKCFLLATYLRTAPMRACCDVLLRLMLLFKQDKPQIKESCATLINELIQIVPPEEVD